MNKKKQYFFIFLNSINNSFWFDPGEVLEYIVSSKAT